jgi:hypothetical protein
MTSPTVYRVWPINDANTWWWVLGESEASAIETVALLKYLDPAKLRTEPDEHHDLPEGMVMDRDGKTETITRSR